MREGGKQGVKILPYFNGSCSDFETPEINRWDSVGSTIFFSKERNSEGKAIENLEIGVNATTAWFRNLRKSRGGCTITAVAWIDSEASKTSERYGFSSVRGSNRSPLECKSILLGLGGQL
jgi:hypothetical protein